MKSNAKSQKEFFLAASISFPFKKGEQHGVCVVFKHVLCVIVKKINTDVLSLSWSGEVFDYLVAHGRMKEKEARSKFRQVWNYCVHSFFVSFCCIQIDMSASKLLLLNKKIVLIMFVKVAEEKKSQKRKIPASYILSKNSKTVLHFLLVSVPKGHFLKLWLTWGLNSFQNILEFYTCSI